jgi:hypothetical protein
MAQEIRRDQPVRLPNPSAQPFVAALKTARFYAVVFFWITMVCITSYAVAFVLMEWVGLYDAPAAEAAAQPGTPEKPAAEPAKDKEPAAAPAPGATSWLGLLENTAQAAPPPPPPPAKAEPPKPAAKEAPKEPGKEHGFMGLPSGASKAGAKEPQPETEPPSSQPITLPAAKAPETAGKVVGTPEVPLPERPQPTAGEQRQRVQEHHHVTANLLKPLRVIGTLTSFLLFITLFLYLQIALLGRLAGIRQLTNSLFLMLLFMAAVMPWDSVFPDFRISAFYDFGKLTAEHAARIKEAADMDTWKHVTYFARFFASPVIAALLLAWSGIQFASGYGESVVANE